MKAIAYVVCVSDNKLSSELPTAALIALEESLVVPLCHSYSILVSDEPVILA